MSEISLSDVKIKFDGKELTELELGGKTMMLVEGVWVECFFDTKTQTYQPIK